MPKPKKQCDETLQRWFDEALGRIKTATGARTQVQLAEVLDVRQSSISDAKRRCSIPAEWYLKLYRSHGLDPDWISNGTEPVYLNPNKAKMPAESILKESAAPYGKPHSRGRVVSVSTMSGAEGDKWAPQAVADLNIPESYHVSGLVVVRVDNTAMDPIIKRGAFVGIDQDQKQHPDGDLCAVFFPHQGLIIRKAYLQNGNFVLKAENGSYDDLTIPAAEMVKRTVGRVVWTMQKLDG